MSTNGAVGPLQTVDRALSILGLFTPASPEVTVSQAAAALGVSRSIASRLLAALEARHFVAQDPDTGRFRLGVRNLDLGALYLQSHRLVVAATPYLEQLGQDESLVLKANLFILDGGEALRLASYPARPLTRLRIPLHCTASGKVLLASLSEVALDQIVTARGLPARTPRTITDSSALRDCLEEVRTRGYAIDAEENELGGHCYAAPIADVVRRPVGAVSVSVTSAVPPSAEQSMRLIQAVTDAARRISESLGSGRVWESVPADSLSSIRSSRPS
ncbi:MAG: IclR family transcriptional regulator, regulon repressor [Thermomicrobiales bacterium]|nr:IclR family transcriptional regulator, regulon repressor [Thermomicrobiales bacterium]